jgi:hypothetical protein
VQQYCSRTSGKDGTTDLPEHINVAVSTMGLVLASSTEAMRSAHCICLAGDTPHMTCRWSGRWLGSTQQGTNHRVLPFNPLCLTGGKLHINLQMVGQKLLFHAANQFPALLALPSAIPSYVIFSLYTRPFAEALRLVSSGGRGYDKLGTQALPDACCQHHWLLPCQVETSGIRSVHERVGCSVNQMFTTCVT